MRILAAIAGSVLLGSLMAGCGTDDEDQPQALSRADLESALLTVDDLGEEFEVAEEDEDEDDDPGCLDDIPDLDDDDERAEALYRIENRVDVDLAVLDYGSEAELEDALNDAAAAYEDCTTVDDTMDGIRFELTVSSDTDAVEGVDQQVNSEATGTLSFQGRTVPVNVTIRAARIDDYLLGIAFVSQDSVGGAADLLLDAAIARFNAVRDGEEPPEPEPVLEDYIASLDLGQEA